MHKERIEKAAEKYADFMDIILPGWEQNTHSKGTPMRVAKMWINELLAGIYSDPLIITEFDNGDYDGMVFQGKIPVYSLCAHHHLPFTGFAHVSYLPVKGGKIIGLSKLNRIVNHCSRRPQVQEQLTMDISEMIQKHTENLGIAVMIESEHMCVACRGIKQKSTMITSKLTGMYFSNEIGTRDEFYYFVSQVKK